MRPFVPLLVALLVIGPAACEWVDIECAACDDTCWETCQDACSWLQKAPSARYNCADSATRNYLDCYCDTAPWVVLSLSLSGLALLVALCCGPPLAIVGYYWRYDAEQPLEPAAPGAYRLYSALNPCLYRGAVTWLTLVSCSLCRPLLLLESTRMMLRRVSVRGTRLSLNAEWPDYCKLVWLPTCLFNALSCGFYTCCGFAERREDEFLDERTSVDGHPGEPVVFFRAKAEFWYRWVAGMVTAWTCGLTYSFFYVELVAKSVGMVRVAGVGASAVMKAGQFFTDVWLRTCFFNCLSCCFYSLCGFGRRHEAQYTDEHLAPRASPGLLSGESTELAMSSSDPHDAYDSETDDYDSV